MNDTILIIIIFLAIAIGVWEITEQNDKRLRPSTATFCKIETIGHENGGCLK